MLNVMVEEKKKWKKNDPVRKGKTKDKGNPIKYVVLVKISDKHAPNASFPPLGRVIVDSAKQNR